MLSPDKYNEMILVVKRTVLFQKESWTGILETNFNHYLTLIEQNQEYMPRGLAEEDFSYKQIIPYVIFRFENHYFLMQRKESSSEQRLANKYSLGIGGHMRKEDLKGSSIFSWAQREFYEEVFYKGSLLVTPLGILNLETTPVDQVHLGLVLLLEGDNPHIKIKSELKSGHLATLEECKEKNLENWSMLIVEYLQNKAITKSMPSIEKSFS